MKSSNYKILIVDDSPGMRKLLTIICRSVGITKVAEVGDGKQAWQYVQNQSIDSPIDLIISDYTMPEMTGLELLKLVRASSKHAHIPFFMVTAESQPNLLKEIHDAGANSVLTKPFTSTDLTDAMRKLISIKAA